MATSHSTHGTLKLKQVDLMNTIVFHGVSDESKKVSIFQEEPTAVGNFKFTIPAITADVVALHNASNLDASKIVNVEDLTSVSLADGDSILFSDVSDADAVKRCTGTNLKSFLNVSELAGQTENDILVANSSGDMVGVSVSGDLTNVAGSFTVANGAITGAKLAVGCINNNNLFAANVVNTAAIGANQITAAKIAHSVITNTHISASAAIDGTKVSPNFGAQNVQTSVDYLAASTSNYYFGDASTDGTFRLVRSGDDLLVQKRVAGSYVTKHTFS
jgi:hypothetical protein